MKKVDLTILDGLMGNAKPPVKENADADYDKRIKAVFKIAYEFIEKHKHRRTDVDWERTVNDIPKTTDPLTVRLMCVVLEELEREYNEMIK